MRTTITILLAWAWMATYGQTDNHTLLLDSAKTLFRSTNDMDQAEIDRFDYNRIVTLLEKVIELSPDNTEARYYLGYTYSRINSRDGRSMIDMNIDLVQKASQQLEKVIELTPKYTGETIILDPYSKLTAEWGSMAMSYYHNQQPDSAMWAFEEGKKRGGFDDFILRLNKNVLDACSPNAILISSGDNSSIPLWFCQIVGNYRTDVTVVDVSLLNTQWYPEFLSKGQSVTFDYPAEVLDTLNYTTWTDTTVTINDFSWTVKPSFYDRYLLRGDRILLSLLRENKFRRDVYFTIGFPVDNQLGLKSHLSPLVIVDRTSTADKHSLSFEAYKTQLSQILSLSKYLNLNSPDEQRLFDYFRYNLLGRVREYLTGNDRKKAKELLELLDKWADDKKFSYLDERVTEYIEYLRQE